ncbi:Retrovirus-related Pol polyprotein from transposon 17.6 [Vitis vinifera]|uniref:Retrovirus-related Pol polyprotein from transposon 17.6 n=1 Tax=Vitis vinifera TaxID=29760 RepID=A0A438GKU4_VITVI|nr:Retrovirus-related Pol polyprotein from transposon 17.6 [Vitis vinifera]
MDLSIFEYLPVSCDIDLSAPSSPTSQIFDIDDEIAQHDSDDDSSSVSDSDPVDQRVSPAMRGTASSSCSEHIWTFAWSYEDMPGLDPSIVQHRLPLLPHARPVKQKLRRLHPRWSLQVKEEIQKQLSVGFLSVVEYPEWLANVVPVPKKDGKILMAPEDMEKTSFITEWGTYCYRVMPFGLKNAGATYQRAATTLFHDMMHRDVEVYVDDMIVKSRGRSDHLAALERFFERIRQFRLRLNPKKCTFGVTSGKLLGYMVSERGIEVDPDKIRAILTCLHRGQRRGQRLPGQTSVHQQIHCQIDRHLEYLLSPPVWRLLHQAVLYSYTCRSDVALGCMLAQLDDSGKDRAIYYLKVHQREHCRRSLASLPVSDARAIDDDFPDEDVAAVTSLSGWRISVRLAFSDRHPATNNIVEYEACILGLETALELGIRQMEVFGDSNLNQFADALATLASMIDIPVDATVRPLLIESRSAPAYCCLIDDVEPDDGLPWILLVDHGDRLLPVCSEVSRVSDTRRSHSRAALRAARTDFTMAIFVWGIDIIGKISPKSSSGHEFILVAIDYFTKWVEAASYARLTSSGVASFIRSHIICRYGVPHELISDRGVHFRAEVDTLVQRYGIRHHRSSAYRPQTNGAVEAANKNIKRILRRMVETSRDWSEKLPFALWAYRTSFRTSTGATPYSLVYGMEAMLPVEIEMGSLRVALEQQIPEADWAQARFDQLNLLDERRLRAADHVRAYQRKMARAFKKRVKPRPLQELTPEGAAWLMDLDGNRFSEPTNVDQLKRSDSVVFGLPGSFMDPHGLARSSLTGCSSRRGHDRYLTEPLRSTQPGPHFSTLGFHHASPSGRYILDMCA